MPMVRYARPKRHRASRNGFALYRESDPLSAVEGVDPDAFFEASYDTVLDMMIKHVIEEEGPILDTTLARRIARVHGWKKPGQEFVIE